MAIFRLIFIFSLLFTLSCAGIFLKQTRVLNDDAISQISLQDLRKEQVDLKKIIDSHQATVLIWWATTCPCVARYQSRMEQLQNDFGEKQVAVIAVASNSDDDAESIASIAAKRNFSLPIVLDTQGSLAQLLGVRSTPTAILVDQTGRVRFRGWIDNERQPGEDGRIAYLQDVLERLLHGESSPAQYAPVYGCPITKNL